MKLAPGQHRLSIAVVVCFVMSIAIYFVPVADHRIRWAYAFAVSGMFMLYCLAILVWHLLGRIDKLEQMLVAVQQTEKIGDG